MNVAEMIKNVNVECHPVTNVDNSIRRWLNQGQKIIATKGPKHGWFWLRQFDYTFATTATQEEYALSPLVDTSKIIQLRDEDTPRLITNMTDQHFRTFEPGPTSTGEAFIYRLVGFSPVQNQPTSASVITLVSNDSSDNQVVNIQGRDANDVLIQQAVTLNGTTPVVSTISIVTFMSLSKSAASVGSITVTSNGGVVTNVIMSPSSRNTDHPVIKLHNIPDATKTITYDFIMKLPNISGDNDISLIPEQYHDAIELYAISKCYKHLNNATMWQASFGEFGQRVNDMLGDDSQPSQVFTLGDFESTGLAEAVLPSNFPRD